MYLSFGGHKAIANACVDDLKLGELIKKHGFSQEVVDAQDYISITWYHSLREMFSGLQKNCFAFFNYKIFPIVWATFFWTTLFVWPVYACFFTAGYCQLINLFNTSLLILTNLVIAQFFKKPKLYAFFFFMGTSIYLYPIYSSMLRFWMNGGIYWRNTFYSAKMLKKDNC